jgi:signal transduction histidine kinase
MGQAEKQGKVQEKVQEKKNSLLIVDDDTDEIIFLQSVLSPEYTVYAAKDGETAIKLATKHLPDLIVLDIIMPEMSGYKVLSILKSEEATRNIPVIYVTGLDSHENEEIGLSLGAVDYISKPFFPDIVRLRVRTQIKLVNHIRALEERDEMERQLNKIRELESGLIAAKERAEHFSRAKSEFLSRMSNEMLTPMNVIMGMTKVAKMQDMTDDMKKYLGEIDKASGHLLHIINDVLDVSGVEHGIFKLNESEFSFGVMFESLLKNMLKNADVKHINVSRDIDPKIPEMLVGDEKRLSQVLSNMLSNAIKYTPENGEISIKSQVINEDDKTITLQFEVIDNGMGISQEQQKIIFEIFEQLDGSNTRKHGGIGIGLALSKSIVEMMGGKISVESELGQGSKFIFTCKLKKA